RLVEHVHDAGQARSDLRCKPDALRLAARKRLGRAVERQVIEPDIVQELQPAHDLLHDLVGDRLALPFELQLAKELAGFLQRAVADLVDRALVAGRTDLHMPRLAPQASPFTLGTRLRIQIFGQLLAHHDRIGLAIAALEVRDDALERVLARHRLAAVGQILEGDLFLVAAVQDHLLDALRQLVERLVQIEAVMLAEALQHLEIELVAAVPALDRARGERELRKRDDPLRVEKADRAQPVAARAGAHRIVERKKARLELFQRIVADRAGELGRIQMLDVAVHLDRDRAPVAVAQRRLERFGDPLLEVGAHAQPVDDDLDRVLGVLGELRHDVDLVHLAVDAHAHETLGAELDEKLDLLALAVDDRRREDHQPRFLRQPEDCIDHLRDRHRGELLLRMVRTVGLADAGKQQPQIIVDLGDRAHCRPRIVRGRLLLDRDRRRQPLDQIDVRFFHQLQELPRVRRQRLDVAPLPLGIERVEGERAFSRARQAGDHDQPMTRQIEVDVLQIVGARTPDSDVVHAGALRCRKALRQPANILLFARSFDADKQPASDRAGRHSFDRIGAHRLQPAIRTMRNAEPAKRRGAGSNERITHGRSSMASVNKVILVGNLGRDPETRYTTGGEAVTNISIATTDTWKDKAGEKQERTEWHRVAFFGKLAEIAGEYLKKGSQVYVEGRLQTRKWQDKEGQEKYTTEIIADRMQMLGSRAGAGGGGGEPPPERE